MKNATRVIEMAETSASDLMVADHRQPYTHIIVHVAGGEITDAAKIETTDGYYRNNNGWHSVLRVGCGCPCNCDACYSGDDPGDWAGQDYDGCDALITEMHEAIDQLAW